MALFQAMTQASWLGASYGAKVFPCSPRKHHRSALNVEKTNSIFKSFLDQDMICIPPPTFYFPALITWFNLHAKKLKSVMPG